MLDWTSSKLPANANDKQNVLLSYPYFFPWSPAFLKQICNLRLGAPYAPLERLLPLDARLAKRLGRIVQVNTAASRPPLITCPSINLKLWFFPLMQAPDHKCPRSSQNMYDWSNAFPDRDSREVGTIELHAWFPYGVSVSWRSHLFM
jgi:hypothetical protein